MNLICISVIGELTENLHERTVGMRSEKGKSKEDEIDAQRYLEILSKYSLEKDLLMTECNIKIVSRYLPTILH